MFETTLPPLPPLDKKNWMQGSYRHPSFILISVDNKQLLT